MYSGNSTVVNWLMRFPILIPVAVAVGVVSVVPKEEPPAPPAPPAIVVQAPPPPPPAVVPPAQVTPKPVEALCPPKAELTPQKLAKLTKQEQAALRTKGCIKG